MARGKNQKLKLYRVYQYLLKKTDENHSVTLREIKDALERDYDISADRKSLYDDIECTSAMGLIVEGNQVGSGYYYQVVKKHFELAELKLLVDAIQSAKFISERKSNSLIKKLEAFASEYEAKELQRQVVISGRVKTMNESIYYNVDEVHRAIADNKRIKFQYWQWNLNKQMVPRRGGKPYEVSPWVLLWDNENYYLVAFDEEDQIIKHYRVDKMKSISMTEEKRNGAKEFDKFDAAKYARQSFGMYGGSEKTVRIKFKDELAGVMIDRFGKDIPIRPSDEKGFSETRVSVAVSNQFFGWVFALGKDVQILSPEDTVKEFRECVKSVVDLY